MKLTFEPSAGEAEVVVRGDPGDPEVPRILAALQTAAVRQGRLLLRKAGTEREYLLEPEEITSVTWSEDQTKTTFPRGRAACWPAPAARTTRRACASTS